MPEPESTSLRSRFFTAWADFVTARPLAVLLVCGFLAAASVGYTAKFLEFRSDRSELVDPSLPFQQRYADFRARFPRWDDAAVVVDLASGARENAADAFITALESRLGADADRFSAVTAGFSADETPPSLILTEPLERVKEHVAQMKRSTVVINAANLDNLLRLSLMGAAVLGTDERAQVTALLHRALEAAKGERPDVLGLDSSVRRLVRPGGTLATVLVSLRHKSTDADKIASIASLRDHLRALQNQPEFAGVEAGVTGVPVLEADETAQSTRDGQRAGFLSLAAIALLMVVAYRGVVVPLLAVGALLIGVAWAFAWATLAVGHLQLLSVTFAAMLMGLGIDVAIHLVARLEIAHPNHDGLRGAVASVFRGVGPGIVTASVTVAAGAGAMALTPFAGVAEMGVIAAGGILLCTAAIMSALPAMLMLLKDPARRLRARAGDGEADGSRVFLGLLGMSMGRRPWPVLAAAAALTIGAGVLAWRVGYDTDLQNLMPDGSESVAWQHRLERDDERSVWHAVVLADTVDEARDLTLRLRALPEVSEVGGAGMLFQPEADLRAKQGLLRTMPDESFYHDAMRQDPEPSPAALRAVCDALAEAFQQKDAPLADAARALARQPDDALLMAMNAYTNDRGRLASTLLALRDAEPLPPERLPRALKETMLAPDGALLLRVYPKQAPADPSAHNPPNHHVGVLAPERLGPFARAVLAAAPDATGPTVQIYESTRLITRAYRDAALSALAAITLLLLIDFRSLADTLCALLPVALGAALMLAAMRLLGMDLNLANLIVMPLIVGIGVGCGVHAVRRWRLQPNDPPPGLAGGSGRAITLTTLTTVLGFAALIPGEHRGIQSLGIVMSLGLTLVWAVTIFVLPAVLRLRGVVSGTTPSASTRVSPKP